MLCTVERLHTTASSLLREHAANRAHGVELVYRLYSSLEVYMAVGTV
jgi:hypothetical protein